MTDRVSLLLVTFLTVAVAGACSHAGQPADTGDAWPAMPRPVGGSPDQPPTSAMVPGSVYIAERNRCVDRELARRGLNEYGDPPATEYPAGSPLLNAVTGVVTDRHEYVMKRWRDIATTCTSSVVDR